MSNEKAVRHESDQPTQPAKNAVSARGWNLWMTLGVVCGLAITGTIYHLYPRFDPVREEAWDKVTPRLEKTTEETQKAVDPSTELVSDFFDRQRGNARAFAGDVISMSGKWAYAKSLIYGGSHDKYIEECFRRHLFTPDELKSTIESAVTRYVGEIQGLENRLLVDISADLEGSELATPAYLPALGDSERFRIEYQAMLEQVLPIVSRDLGMTVTREMAAFVGGEIASVLVMEIGASLATNLGVSGGILSAGAYSGAFTFGVGLVAGILVDMALDWVIRQQGYDPEGEIAAKVIASLDKLESLILNGSPESRKRYEDQKWNARWSLRSSSREIAQIFVRQIENNGELGLRFQLRKIHDVRSRMRDEALKALILTGGAQ